LDNLVDEAPILEQRHHLGVDHTVPVFFRRLNSRFNRSNLDVVF
jgi:hypothetical protein